MKVVSLVLVLLLGLLLLSAAWVRAEATTIQVIGNERAVSALPPQKRWVSDDGILHVRDREARNVFVGTCGGDPCSFDVPFVANRNQNLTTGDGELFGSFAYVVDGTTFTWGTHVGRFDGRWHGKIDGATGFAHIEFVAEGSGDFEGMKLMGSGTVPPPSVSPLHPIEATILVPHG